MLFLRGEQEREKVQRVDVLGVELKCPLGVRDGLAQLRVKNEIEDEEEV